MNPQTHFELKRSGFGQWMPLVGLVLKNQLSIWMFFVPNVLLNFAGVLTSATTLFFTGSMVADNVSAHIHQYGLNYGAYILTGMMFTSLVQVTTSGYHEACLDGYWNMEFDVYIQHPSGIFAYLTGSILFKYLISAINSGLFLLACIYLFHVPIVLPSMGGVFMLVFVALLSLTGIGLAEASTFALLNMKARGANPLQLVLGFLAATVSGAYIPLSALPPWLAALSQWLPHTHALNMLRLYLSGREPLWSPVILADIGFLLKFTLIALPVGVLLFAAGMRKAQRDGHLTRWS
jgi:ABC-type multidrug transport system permease subunit